MALFYFHPFRSILFAKLKPDSRRAKKKANKILLTQIALAFHLCNLSFGFSPHSFFLGFLCNYSHAPNEFLCFIFFF